MKELPGTPRSFAACMLMAPPAYGLRAKFYLASKTFASVVTRKLVNRRSVAILPSCKAEHARRSGRYGEMFQRGRKVKEGRRWLMNLRVTTLDRPDPNNR